MLMSYQDIIVEKIAKSDSIYHNQLVNIWLTTHEKIY